MIKVEVCINCDGEQSLRDSVEAAYSGGASTIELCGEMQVDGLTPKLDSITEARKAFREKSGLMVMIRPRAENFSYSKKEIFEMKEQIKIASNAGADGVVFGVLNNQNNLDVDSMISLIELSKQNNLLITFHRAFDATPNPIETIELLINLGVNRVLTSGTKWGNKKSALDGITCLNQIIEKAKNKIEIVIAGGVNNKNVGIILNQLNLSYCKISVHSYSGVQKNGFTQTELVKSLVEQVEKI
ncbi:MAG: copper homeostasis protein CutC [Ignavibacteriae bacterium]|nr:copper homeostasis protein CutC [Ignavibacteriota bacterium]